MEKLAIEVFNRYEKKYLMDNDTYEKIKIFSQNIWSLMNTIK